MIVKRIVRGAAMFAAVVTVSAARAATVANPSFQADVIDPNTNPFGAQPGATGWNVTGGTNSGTFLNPTADDAPPPTGTGSKRIQNADGTQLAFIGVQGTSGLAGGNTFSQLLGESYQQGQVYSLTLGIAKSSVQPPTPADSAMLRFEFYYVDTSGNQVAVGTPRVVVDNAATDNIQNDLLKYFTVQTPLVAMSDPFYNQTIGILFTTVDNPATSGGFFDVDNVVVTPEPSAALLGGVGLALAAAWRPRRRRA